jgi:N6-L-threonylcarbamoyladenine synthase
MMHHAVGEAKSIGGQLQYRLGVGASSGLPAAIARGEDMFTVLGIETSCDDTGAAVVRSDGAILGEALASQHEIHECYGGVVPGLARDAHECNIDAVVERALRQAGLSAADVDAVAVTIGPGLEICLRVGATFARALAQQYSKPFVAVHHLEAHCLLVRPHLLSPPHSSTEQSKTDYGNRAAKSEGPARQVEFPFMALLVSGGHCQILLCHAVGNYTVLGGTLDDALGEAYDKAARMLGLRTAGAGGPAIEKLALDGDPTSVPLPVPMQKRKDCDFSYAGLKNAFRLAVEAAAEECAQQEEARGGGDKGVEEETWSEGGRSTTVNVEDAASSRLPHQAKADLAASFQRVAIRHLTDRLKRALDWYDGIATPMPSNDGRALVESQSQLGPSALAVVGGVAANRAVRAALHELCASRSPPLKLVAPPPRLCTDNGVMVAWAAIEKLQLGVSDELGEEIFPRWPLGESANAKGWAQTNTDRFCDRLCSKEAERSKGGSRETPEDPPF